MPIYSGADLARGEESSEKPSIVEVDAVFLTKPAHHLMTYLR